VGAAGAGVKGVDRYEKVDLDNHKCFGDWFCRGSVL
jgi:hypothetical protein